jgi:hypothetical protein
MPLTIGYPVALLGLATFVLAQSQPPTPSPTKSGQHPQQQSAPSKQPPATDKRGTDDSPLLIKVLPAQKTQEEAAEEKAQKDREASTNRLTLIFTGIAAVIAMFQLIVFGYQALMLKRTINTMERISADQTKDTRDSIGVSTRAAKAMEETSGAIATSIEVIRQTAEHTKENVRIASEMLATDRESLGDTRAINRARVAMSHSQRTREMNAGRLDVDDRGAVFFEIAVTNHGNTPADVLGGVIAVEIGPDGTDAPPTIPTKAYQCIAPAFLVPGSHITMTGLLFGISRDEILRAFKPNLLEGPPPLELWLVGFVCYRDTFGSEYCGGYARHWHRDTADLVFDSTTAHLNFDRLLSERERGLCQPKTSIS